MIRARRRARLTLAAPPPDPFGEHCRLPFRKHLRLLGGHVEFESNSVRLLRLALDAYQGLPQHQLTRKAPRLTLSLLLTSRQRVRAGSEPPAVRSLAAHGILCGAFDDAGFVALSPQQRSGLLIVPAELLRYPYHIRYELLEFAVYVLAARTQRLVPLHAGCLGRAGEGILLIGASGCGKSTMVLHGLLSGLELLAEDSVLVEPQRLLATGVASFVHLREDALRFLTDSQRKTIVRNSAHIRRRSGVRKLEIDVRSIGFALARPPLRIRAVVFLSRRTARGRRLLAPLGSDTMLRRLEASQRYAAQQPGWAIFRRQIRDLPSYELRRGAHPDAGIEAVENELLPTA
jgi:energy-coupling factor transporter ATP-binding protein EcfA2